MPGLASPDLECRCCSAKTSEHDSGVRASTRAERIGASPTFIHPHLLLLRRRVFDIVLSPPQASPSTNSPLPAAATAPYCAVPLTALPSRGSHHQIICLTRRAPYCTIVQHRPVPFDICNKVTLTSLFGGPPLLLPRYCTSCPATLSLPFHFCPFTSHSVSLGTLCISSSRPEVRLATKTTFWSSQIDLLASHSFFDDNCVSSNQRRHHRLSNYLSSSTNIC